MRIELEQFFAFPLPRVVATTLDAAWPRFMVEHSGVMRRQELLSQQESGHQLTRSIRHAPRPSIDRVGPLAFPVELFEFTEHSTWDRRANRLTFENVPALAAAAAQVRNQGEVHYERAPGGTRRVVRTEIALLRLPLLMRPFASLIEHALEREATRLLEAEAATMQRWLERGQTTVAAPLSL